MGNPLTSEVAAFRWVVAVLLAAISVGLVAKLIGSVAAIYYGILLLLVLAGFIAKGMVYMLSSPDEDEDEDENEEDGDVEDVVTELKSGDYNE